MPHQPEERRLGLARPLRLLKPQSRKSPQHLEALRPPKDMPIYPREDTVPAPGRAGVAGNRCPSGAAVAELWRRCRRQKGPPLAASPLKRMLLHGQDPLRISPKLEKLGFEISGAGAGNRNLPFISWRLLAASLASGSTLSLQRRRRTGRARHRHRPGQLDVHRLGRRRARGGRGPHADRDLRIKRRRSNGVARPRFREAAGSSREAARRMAAMELDSTPAEIAEAA